MFSSLVSSKDLFSTNPSQVLGNRYDYSDSALTSSQSNSQYPNSQLEYSQLVAGSSQEFNQSPSKKYYQRYMSKPSIFSKDNNPGHSKLPPSSKNYQQHIQVNKALAKERDERDLLDSIVLTVKQCSSEVSHAVEAVKENIHEGMKTSDKKLVGYLEKIESRMSEQYGEILNALKYRDKEKESIQMLKNEIASKNATIDHLKGHIEKLESEQQQKIIGELRDFHNEHIEFNKGQFQTLTSQSVKLQKENQKLVEKQTKERQQESVKRQKYLRQLEERLIHEFEQAMGRVNSNIQDMNNHYQTQLHNSHQALLTGIESELNQKLNKTTKTQLEKCQKQVTELQRKQEGELHNLIEQQVKERCESQRLKYKEEIHKLHSMERQSLENELHQRFSQQDNLQQRLQEQYDQQLKDLQSRHEAELNKVRQQSQTLQCNQKNKVAPMVNTSQDIVKHQTNSSSNEGFIQSQRHMLISPSTRQWSSKTLFSKSYTSPVVAVKPQVQRPANRFTFSPVRMPVPFPASNTVPSTIAQYSQNHQLIPNDTAPMDVNQPVEMKPKAKKKGKRRKKSSLTYPKRARHTRQSSAAKTQQIEENEHQVNEKQVEVQTVTRSKKKCLESNRKVKEAMDCENDANTTKAAKLKSVFDFQDDKSVGPIQDFRIYNTKSTEVVSSYASWNSPEYQQRQSNNPSVSMSSEVRMTGMSVKPSFSRDRMRRSNSCSNIFTKHNKLILKAHHSFSASQDSSDDELGFFYDNESQESSSQKSFALASSPETFVTRKLQSSYSKSASDWV